MPDTVTADEVLNDVFEEIKEGAKESRCKISQDAEAMYRRRYRSSVQAKLDANDPGDWKNLHKQHVIKVGRRMARSPASFAASISTWKRPAPLTK
jgi:hypothetical protein